MIALILGCSSPEIPAPTTPSSPSSPTSTWTTSLGGQSGSDPGYGPCAVVGVLQPDDVVVSADGDLTGTGLRGLAEGSFDADLRWDDDTSTTLHAELVWDGAIRELGSAGSSSSGCEPGIEIDGTVAFASDDGRVDLSGAAILRATRPTAAAVDGDWPDVELAAQVDQTGLRGSVWLGDLDVTGSFQP